MLLCSQLKLVTIVHHP
uniref:Uncharacterized protein n=1 Tax=Anguilla anguilla TaxID=7936 RepID=A0A0E9UQ57_ANGAN